jgi:hypothetical protein
MTKHHSFRFGRRVAPVALVCAGVLGVSAAASAGLSTGTLAQAPDHPFPGTRIRPHWAARTTPMPR